MSRPLGPPVPPVLLAPPAFSRTTLVPVAVLTLALTGTAVVTGRWLQVAAIAGAAPLALLLLWASRTEASARRGVPIRPAAQAAAVVVMVLGILACATVCALALTAPHLLGLTAAH